MTQNARAMNFFDIETTGTNIRFDQPTQFAAVLTDGQLNQHQQIVRRCRPRRHTLPHPGALVVTGVSFEQLISEQTSHYAMMTEIDGLCRAWPPTIHLGFNSLRFDEEMLRSNLWQCLHNPYATQFYGHSRLDVMAIARAVYFLAPQSIATIVGTSGRRSFKLQDLASANAIVSLNAHEALDDCKTTIALFALMRDREPDLVEFCVQRSDKQLCARTIHQSPYFFELRGCLTGAVGSVAMAPLCSPSRATEVVSFDLEFDPSRYLSMDLADILATLKAKRPSALKATKTNACPFVASADDPFSERFVSQTRRAVLAQRAAQVRSDQHFIDRVAKAWRLKQEEYPVSEHIEETIYNGFPDSNDEAILRQFHVSPEDERWGLVQRLRDGRYRKLAERLIAEEWPTEMPKADKARVDSEVFERLTTRSTVPWLTVHAALVAAEKSAAACSEAAAKILKEYVSFLKALERDAPSTVPFSLAAD